jgi:hypothetical protein
MLRDGELNFGIQPTDRSLMADFYSRRSHRWTPRSLNVWPLWMTTMATFALIILVNEPGSSKQSPFIDTTPTMTTTPTITPRSTDEILTIL